jgi:hypothetical protein
MPNIKNLRKKMAFWWQPRRAAADCHLSQSISLSQ